MLYGIVGKIRKHSKSKLQNNSAPAAITNAKMTSTEQYLDKLREFYELYAAQYGIVRIGIFGSVARGEQTPDSDVDVLVEAPVLDLLSLIGMKARLETLFAGPVDVVRKTDYMPARFKARIENEVIYV